METKQIQMTAGKTATKLVLLATPEIKALVNEYNELNSGRGYDARKKNYKESTSRMEAIQKECNSILKLQALEYLKTHSIALEYTDGFKIDANAYVYISYGSKEEIEMKASLISPQVRGYKSSFNLIKTNIEDVKEAINEEVVEHSEKIAKEKARIEVADKMLQEVKDDITYKDYSYEYEKNPENKWSGSELSVRYISTENNFSKEAKIELDIIKADFIDVEFRVRTNFKTVEEAKAFWTEANKFIATQTKGYVKERTR